MLVNQSLSNFSDISFQTAFIIYAIALILSLVYYGRVQGIVARRRALKADATAERSAKELVTVGGTGPDVGTTAFAGSDGATDLPAGIGHPTGAGVDKPALAADEAKADKWGGMTQSVIWLGIILHFTAIVLRGLATSRFPFGNLYEYVLMVTGITMVAASIAIQRKEWRTLWPWLLTPILVLMFYGGTKLYAESAPVVPALQSHWLPIHVSVVSTGASIGIVSGIASLLHMLRVWQPKGRESGVFGAIARPLPSAVKLDQLAYRTAVITLPVLGVGIVLGAIWAESAWGRFWGWDPKETVSFASWVLYAAYLHARATPMFRKAAPWINILALATMIFNLFFINMVVSGLHSYAGLN